MPRAVFVGQDDYLAQMQRAKQDCQAAITASLSDACAQDSSVLDCVNRKPLQGSNTSNFALAEKISHFVHNKFISHDGSFGSQEDNFATFKKSSKKKSRGQNLEIENVFSAGKLCTVRKHLTLGCAVVSFTSDDVQKSVLSYAEQHRHQLNGWPTVQLGPHVIALKPHHDKATGQTDETSLFAFWGHQAEKKWPIDVVLISEEFDRIIEEVQSRDFTAFEQYEVMEVQV
eukprot:TRINITY_DN49947_c0_g1_i1.p1 TRINITY_DN49947_c0_g1~~TRINITY_DN49947_c0_g1_i1.p1  ORF type:complete len:229 (-),score=36.96 TRINITY_DN49947_c0_g1_i1:180-866(-)